MTVPDTLALDVIAAALGMDWTEAQQIENIFSQQHGQSMNYNMIAVAAIGRLRERLEGATRDTERLDRLEKLIVGFGNLDFEIDGGTFHVWTSGGKCLIVAPTLRGCLDQLTQQEEK